MLPKNPRDSDYVSQYIYVMSTITFDTLELFKELKTAGFTEPQAEAVTRAFKRSHDIDHLGDTTRSDIASAKIESVSVKERLNGVEAKLSADIALMRSEMRELESHMTIKLGTMILGMTGLIIAALKYFIMP
jgi:hypothetical protein